MDLLRDRAAALLGAAEPAAVVEVVQALGSVPRGCGTRMLVLPDATEGTIGGGHLEWQAIARARALLQHAEARPGTQHYPLGPALGQCCGGAVTLRFDRLDAAVLARWPERAPRFHLQLHGAGHVGRAIARALAPLDATVDWIDERETGFTFRVDDADAASEAAWPAHVRRLTTDACEVEVGTAPPGAFYLVLTHRHDLDLRIADAILRRGDFGFFGLIGSRTKRARFVARLTERGHAPERIARMTCPIGLPGIDGKEPAVIAATVVAQLLLVAGAMAPGGRDAATSLSAASGRSPHPLSRA